MKNAELVRLGAEILKKMSKSDLMRDDWRYVAIYDEYATMRQNGEKYNYAISFLSWKHNISESTLKRVIRRLGKEVIS